MVWPTNRPIDKASFAHTRTDRPVHTVVFCLAVAGLLLLSVSRAWPGLFRSPQSAAGYVEIPLNDREETSTHEEILPNRGGRVAGPALPISRLLLVASICALTVRIELFRRIYKATECTISSVEVIPSFQRNHTFQPLLTTSQQIILPLSISIYDALRIQRPRQSENEESPDGSIYDAGFASLQRIIRGSRWRYIPPASALVLGSYMALGLWSGLTSTYICPSVVGETRSIPLMQWLGAALDSFLAIAAHELCLPQSTPFGTSRGRGPTIWSTILIVGC
jgi:hypothetical protein